MKKRSVLFVAEAVTLAHVGRMVQLAAGLNQDKFSTTLSWDGRFNSAVGVLPAPWVPLETISTSYFIERLSKGLPIYTRQILDRYIRAELELFRATSPDVVVGDTRFSLLISAKLAKVPYINVVNAHWSPYARNEWTVPQWPVVDLFGPTIGQMIFDCLRPLLFFAYAKGMNGLLKKWGLPTMGTDLRAVYCAGDRVVYPDISEVVPTEGLPKSHRYLGYVPWSTGASLSQEQKLPIPGKKTIYLTMGTSGRQDILSLVLKGLEGRPTRVFISKGSRSSEIRNPDPDHLELIVSPFFSGEQVCAVSDLAIHNGGSGSVAQCVRAGVPFIGVAVNLDQFSSMYFAQKAGIGITLRADRIRSTDISKAAGEILGNPQWKERAEKIRTVALGYDANAILTEVIDSCGDK